MFCPILADYNFLLCLSCSIRGKVSLWPFSYDFVQKMCGLFSLLSSCRVSETLGTNIGETKIVLIDRKTCLIHVTFKSLDYVGPVGPGGTVGTNGVVGALGHKGLVEHIEPVLFYKLPWTLDRSTFDLSFILFLSK